MTKSEQYVIAIYILPNKISFEPGKESEETHSLLHGASSISLCIDNI